jgi:hypothetical protein
MWDSFNAKLIDLAPRVPVNRILGDMMPADLLTAFRGQPDGLGRFEWVEVSRCPIATIDPNCPKPMPLDWLQDLSAYAREIANKLPPHWLPRDPTNVMRDGLVILRGESESAATHRSTKRESW